MPPLPTMADTPPHQGLPTHRLRVPAEWIDANDHMNAAYYTVAVKDAAIRAHDVWDYGTAFRTAHRQSNFVIDARVRYLRELRGGTPLRVCARILSVGDKRMWNLYEIWNEGDGSLAALVAYHLLHVHLGPPPRARPIPADLRARLADQRRLHELHPMLGAARDFVASLAIPSAGPTDAV